MTVTVPADKSTRLQGLQVLRVVAALLVLWAHLKFVTGSQSPWIQTAFGAIGVDIFFVISGFVISLTAARRGHEWRGFIVDRFARIAPIYFLLSSVFLVRAIVHQQLDGPLLWNTYAFLPAFDMNEMTQPAHPYGWTLSFEMAFYLGFAAILAAVGGERARIILPCILTAGVTACALWYRSAWFLPTFLFHPLVLEFSAGCLLFHFRRHLTGRVALGMSVLAAALIVPAFNHGELGWHTHVLTDLHLGLLRAGLWGSFAVCIVGMVVWMDMRRPLAWPRPFIVLGDASYSCYLVQPFAMKLTSALLPTGVVAGVGFIVMSLLLGIVSWKFLEKPLTGATRRLMQGARTEQHPSPRLPAIVDNGADAELR
jgi:exopolysaccharide production protein ExoZ